MLSKLRRYLSDSKFRQVISGIFTSKLCYCITVWGGVWNLPGDMRDETTRSKSIAKEDIRKLQVLQNKCMRMLTNMDRDTATSTLLHRTKFLSVHQMIAQHTAVQVFNVFKNRLPLYHSPLYILHTDPIFFPKPDRRYQYSAPFFFLDEILILVPRPPK